jgi:hypothetical protein
MSRRLLVRMYVVVAERFGTKADSKENRTQYAHSPQLSRLTRARSFMTDRNWFDGCRLEREREAAKQLAQSIHAQMKQAPRSVMHSYRSDRGLIT